MAGVSDSYITPARLHSYTYNARHSYCKFTVLASEDSGMEAYCNAVPPYIAR